MRVNLHIFFIIKVLNFVWSLLEQWLMDLVHLYCGLLKESILQTAQMKKVKDFSLGTFGQYIKPVKFLGFL